MDPKIIATIGLKSQNYEVLKGMALEGMNIARINFSHATEEQWHKIKENLASIKKETGLDVKIMADLQGPRIRLGILPEDIKLSEKEEYVFVTKNPDYKKNELPIDFELYKFIKKGEVMYLSNRLVEMEVKKVVGQKIYALVTKGGIIQSRKGINVPKTIITGGALSAKDKKNAKFVAQNGADYISLSFVQTAKDVEDLRKLIKNNAIQIVAKIERASALDNIDEIIKSADGIMVARGDLGIEMPIEEMCIIQKDLIRHSHQYNKPAIVATQMLDSMVKNPFPTRAEASDVANAVFDGADATMLSDETASGAYPVVSVAMMKRIVKRVDEYCNSTNYFETKK